ncbi:MAG: CDP-alcohol phosphatidyltransferase family protein [Candidatus Bathyarchaeota archaeon]|nr:CDP-alcohol phosphatidyltransferase family protein [Candidatus Bathyarchaeota archaeon]
MNVEQLRARCQGEKLKVNSGLTRANRSVSFLLTRLCIRLGVSANQATFSGIVLGVLGGGLFLFGYWWMNLAGIVLLYISLTLDQVDGELARYYGTVSLNGVYLDEIRHLLIYAVPIFCLAFPVAEKTNSPLHFVAGFLSAMVLVVGRIGDRLPLLIYTDRVIMKSNFTGGVFRAAQESTGKGDGIKGGRTMENTSLSLLKWVSFLIYWFYQLVSHQVNILLCLLMITLADFLLSPWVSGSLGAQGLFIWLFALSGLAVLSRTIYCRWRDGWTEETCAVIDRALSH